MKVSIIIPCYNHSEFLADAIDTALIQTYQDIEIIVVNDGSTDTSEQVAKRYGNKIKYHYQENKGLSAARNAGIKLSSGAYIVTLDSDDKLHPDFVLKCVENIGDNDIISTGLQTFGSENRRWITNLEYPKYQNFIQKNHINCCSLFKREIWDAIGGYDENMKEGFEDWDFWTRATRAGYDVRVFPEYLFFYRKHKYGSMFTESMKKRDKIIEFMKTKYSHSKRLIDVVYVIGNGSLYSNFELRYSLRSLEKHCTGWRNIYVIGNKVEFLRNVIFHKFIEGSVAGLNILSKIKYACELPQLSDDFLFINDDHFFFKNMDINEIPYYYDNQYMADIIKKRSKFDNYRCMIEDTARLFSNFDYFDVHKPILFNKAKFLQMCHAYEFEKHMHGLLIKSVYCNHFKVNKLICEDLVIRKRHTTEELNEMLIGESIFSITDDAVNSDLKNFFNNNYPIASQFEM